MVCNKLNHTEKLEALKAGDYHCPAPLVITVGWTMNNWVRYIDLNGTWLR